VSAIVTFVGYPGEHTDVPRGPARHTRDSDHNHTTTRHLAVTGPAGLKSDNPRPDPTRQTPDAGLAAPVPSELYRLGSGVGRARGWLSRVVADEEDDGGNGTGGERDQGVLVCSAPVIPEGGGGVQAVEADNGRALGPLPAPLGPGASADVTVLTYDRRGNRPGLVVQAGNGGACSVTAGDTFELLERIGDDSEAGGRPGWPPTAGIRICQTSGQDDDDAEGNPGRAWLVRPGPPGSGSVLVTALEAGGGDVRHAVLEEGVVITALMPFVTPTTWRPGVAVAGERGQLCVIEVETGEVRARMEGHTAAVTQLVAFVTGTPPHHVWLASGGHDRTLGIYDADTGERVHCLKGHRHWITALVHYAHDGEDR
jgi:hypothetical protein